MGKRFFVIFLLVWYCIVLNAQEDFVSPHPIVLINTDIDSATGLPAVIADEPKVGATMRILYVDETTVNALADTADPSHLHYNGRIGIEIRGSTSQLTPKKSFGLETRKADNSNNNVALLGMPQEHDWILTAFYYEDSYIRDALTYALGRRTGHYAPRTHYCELFLNGAYHGLYLFEEKIKQDKNRVNIKKMNATDNAEPAVTGGYIFKADRYSSNESPAWSTPSSIDSFYVTYLHYYPKPDNITAAQAEYLYNYFNRFQQAVAVGDTSELSGYPSLVDIESFVDYMIVTELASNADGYHLSTFFYKDRQQKLCAGPLWDFNFAYGNDFLGRAGYDVWQFDNGSNTGSPFWKQLFHDPYFHSRLSARWRELTEEGPLGYYSVLSLVDSLVDALHDAVPRDRQRWQLVDYHADVIYDLRKWLRNRYIWISKQLALVPEDGELMLAPNPTHGVVSLLGFSLLPDRIDIYDLRGSPLQSTVLTQQHATVDLSALPPGVYIASIVVGSETVTQKVVKLP